MQPFSICIIMKNEEQNIDRCLSSVKNIFPSDFFAELIVVDTGSTDSSVNIAKKYTNKLYHFEWINDFSAAKNYAISLASNDFVMILDADEAVTDFDEASLTTFMQSGAGIGQIKRINYVEENSISSTYIDYTERFFNKNLFHFAGAIHEQVMPKKPVPGLEYVKLDFTIDHFGYLLDEDKRKEKAERNNELLFKELEKNRNNSYIYFQIGQSYMLMRDFANAEKYFSEGLLLQPQTNLEYVQMMVISYGECLLNLDKEKEALKLLDYYDEFSKLADYVFLIGSIYLSNNMPIQAYKEFLICLSLKDEHSVGVTSYYPLHNIGVINEMLGSVDSAVDFYKKAAAYGYPRSIDRLKELGIFI